MKTRQTTARRGFPLETMCKLAVVASLYYSVLEAFGNNYVAPDGANHTYNVSAPAGTHTFYVDGITSHKYTEWYINNVYKETDESNWLNGYWDPSYSWTFSSGTTVVKAITYNASWQVLNSQIWNVTVDVTGPTTPGMPDLATADDTGSSSTDNLTMYTSGLTFSWSASSDTQSGVAGYEWSLDSGGWNWIGNVTSVDISAGAGGHTFYVRAKDNAGNPGNWSSLGFTVDTTAPGAPTASAPSGDIGTLTPTITWPGNGSWKYQAVVQYYYAFFWWDQWTGPETTGTSAAVPAGQLSWETQYRSLVRACDSAGNWSGWGTGPEFRPHQVPTPGPPGTPDLAAADDTGYSNSDNITYQTTGLTFTWTAATGAERYYYGWDTATPNSSYTSSLTTDINAPGGNGNHTFYVRGWNSAAGYGPASLLTVYIDLNRPYITNLDLRDSDDSGQSSTDNLTKNTNVRYTWTGNANGGSGIRQYNYGWSSTSMPTPTTNPYADVSPPSANGTYTFYVTAEAVSGLWAYYPDYTDQETVTWDTIAPAPPTFVSPTDGQNITDTSPTLDWQDVAGAWKYQVYVREDGLPYWDSRTSPEITSSTWTATPDLGLKAWGWQVKVWDVAGNEGSYGRNGVAGDWGHFTVGLANPVITSISPDKASAGTDTSVTIAGSNFGASQGASKVDFFYKSGEPRIEAPIVSWSGSQIVCKVPVATVNGYAASSSSGDIKVTTGTGSAFSTFKVTFGYGGYNWINWFGSPLAGFRINENTSDCTGEGAAVRNAALSWNSAGAAFSLKYEGTTIRTVSSQNGTNEILWGTVSDSSVIAAATYWYNTILGKLVETDIVFNDALSWSTAATPASNAYDVESIALHEFGHWLNLRDLYGNVGDGVYDNGKVMYGFGSTGATKRNLHTDDIAGIRWIYGASSLRAVVWDAWWTSAVDVDGDGYKRSARLNWDPDVSGGSGSLTVYEKIYWKLNSSSVWNLLATTAEHNITGTEASDAQYRDIAGSNHDGYDWKIEVYRSGNATADYTRDPSNDADLANYALETVEQDTLPSGTLQFAQASYSVNENGGTVTLIVTRTSGSFGAVSVQYATANGSAVAPGDYTATSGTLNWASGETASKPITVPIATDSTPESTESFTVTLSNPAGGATLGSPATATVTIVDDDPPDTTAPAVAITFPANNATVTSPILTVTGTASDRGLGNNGVSSVTVNGVSASGGTATGANTANWSATITLNLGVNTITAVARDTFNNPGQQQITVTYNPPDAAAPTVAISFPANNATVTSPSLAVTGTASDSGRGNNGVSSVTVNGVSATGGTASGANTANWSATVTLNPGANTITAVANDAFNNSGQQQITVTYVPQYTITVSASPAAAGSVGGGGTYASGSSVTVTATNNDGYTFANWTEGGSVVSPLASYTFTLDGNRSLVANFVAGPLQPPNQLTGMRLSRGVWYFSLNGPVGSSYVVQVSSNLVHWVPLVTNVIPAGGSVPITDPTTGQAKRFYRAVVVSNLPADLDVAYVTDTVLGTVRNDYSGWVGMQIVVGTNPVTVTKLGRMMALGNSGTHTVKLLQASGTVGTDVPGGAVSVVMSGGTAGQFQYGSLSSPVKLTAGTTYWVLSQETAGGDRWYDWNTKVTTTGVATDNAVAWGTGPGAWNTDAVANQSFVPVDFKYTSPSAAAYVTGTVLGTPRNDWSGWAGMQIVVGANPLTVRSLGRMMAPGNSGTHTVKLLRAGGTEVLGGAVSIAMSGGTAGQFRYGPLGSPVTLAAGTTYWVLSQETVGGDSWYDWNTKVTTTSVATDNAVAWGTGPGAWNTFAVANQSFGPVNFIYDPASPVPVPVPYVTNVVPGTLRNDYSGWLGMQIVVGADPVVVLQLGRFMASGNSGAHTVKLVKASDGVDVMGGSVAVVMSGGTVGEFLYGSLGASVTLAAGTTYWVLSQEAAGGDKWYDWNTKVTTTSVATDNAAAWGTGLSAWNTFAVPNQSFIPVSFKYAGPAGAMAALSAGASSPSDESHLRAGGPTDANVRVFLGTDLLSSQQIVLRLVGQPGGRYMVESSSDLLAWAPLGSAIVEGQVIDLQDRNVSGTDQRFYRLSPAPGPTEE